MADFVWEQRLSQIATQWSLVRQAHQGQAEAAASAQEQLIERYRGAIHRYLLAALGSRDAADELTQEFALRLLRGDFHRASPQRGRFRDFVKTAVLNLIVDYCRRRKARPGPLPEGLDRLAALCQQPETFDRDFVVSWREELLDRSWQGLAEVERQTGQPLCMVLRLRVDRPELRSAQMAEDLSGRLARTVTGNWVRQVLYQARKAFIGLLVAGVSESLPGASWAEVEEALIDLGLWPYCRQALAQVDGGG